MLGNKKQQPQKPMHESKITVSEMTIEEDLSMTTLKTLLPKVVGLSLVSDLTFEEMHSDIGVKAFNIVYKATGHSIGHIVIAL